MPLRMKTEKLKSKLMIDLMADSVMSKATTRKKKTKRNKMMRDVRMSKKKVIIMKDVSLKLKKKSIENTSYFNRLNYLSRKMK